MQYEPWMLAAMDEAGYNGIRDGHIDAVAEELLRTGLVEIERETFDAACRRRGIDPEQFTQTELNELEEALNRFW